MANYFSSLRELLFDKALGDVPDEDCAGSTVSFPALREVTWVGAFDLARGLSVKELRLFQTMVPISVPPDWIPSRMLAVNLLQTAGEGQETHLACKRCGERLFSKNHLHEPDVKGHGRQIPLDLHEAIHLAFQHFERCLSCSRCGALDYRLLRALCVLSVSGQHRAALLMPQILVAPVSIPELHGAPRTFAMLKRQHSPPGYVCADCNAREGRGFVVHSPLSNTKLVFRPRQQLPPSVRHAASTTAANTIMVTDRFVAEAMPLRAGAAVQGADDVEEQEDVQVCRACGRSGSGAQPLKRCAACREAAYCNTECQRADWPRHRQACERV